jgi:hypothetical protein
VPAIEERFDGSIPTSEIRPAVDQAFRALFFRHLSKYAFIRAARRARSSFEKCERFRAFAALLAMGAGAAADNTTLVPWPLFISRVKDAISSSSSLFLFSRDSSANSSIRNRSLGM